VFEVTMVAPVAFTKYQLAFTLELFCLCGSIWNRFHIRESTMHQPRDHCQEEKFVIGDERESIWN